MFICGEFAVGTRPSRSRICDSCASGDFEKLLKIIADERKTAKINVKKL